MKWLACLLASALVAGCDNPAPRARSVNDFAEDPAVRQAVVARCDADKRNSDPVECANARAAMERLGKVEDTKHTTEHDESFERQRAARRAREDAERRAAAAANPPFDPYSAPVTADPAQAPPKP